MHHILVVDDEPEICEIVRAGFEAGGRYRVACATNKHDAAAALHRGPVDLALLDVLMRDNAGREIDALAGALHVPVLRMTGHPDIIRKSFDEGVPVLAKPFRIGDLVDTVEYLFAETRRLQRRMEENIRAGHELVSAAKANAAAGRIAWEQMCDQWPRLCAQVLKNPLDE